MIRLGLQCWFILDLAIAELAHPGPMSALDQFLKRSGPGASEDRREIPTTSGQWQVSVVPNTYFYGTFIQAAKGRG